MIHTWFRDLGLGFSVLVLLTSSVRADAPATAFPEVKPATVAADAWLKLIDAGKYDQSWKDAAEIFRNAMKMDAWRDMVKGVRTPFGAVVSRTVSSQQFVTSLPGVPPGKYVVIQYRTSFRGKPTAIETVTPMLEKDGKWRVSGYYVR